MSILFILLSANLDARDPVGTYGILLIEVCKLTILCTRIVWGKDCDATQTMSPVTISKLKRGVIRTINVSRTFVNMADFWSQTV